MDRCLYVARHIVEIDEARWPHRVDLTRLGRVLYPCSLRLTVEIEGWLRDNVRYGGWRFAHRAGEFKTASTFTIETVFSLHFADADDAFACKMRWL